MDRDIHVAGEQRSFDFGREQSFSTGVRVNNFGVITACHDDFGLDCDVWMRGSNRILNQQSLGACKVAAPCGEGDLRNHSGNLARDTL
jgi:hypothetical protein